MFEQIFGFLANAFDPAINFIAAHPILTPLAVVSVAAAALSSPVGQALIARHNRKVADRALKVALDAGFEPAGVNAGNIELTHPDGRAASIRTQPSR